MNDTSSIDDLLGGVLRMLDQHPDVRARIILVELSRGASENGAAAAALPPVPGGWTPDDEAKHQLMLKFNMAGHAVIAYIAEQYLERTNEAAYSALQQIKASDPLNRGDIGSFAIWPDQIKHPPSGREAEFGEQKKRLGSDRGHWHYVNIPFDPANPDAEVDLPNASGDLLKQLPGQIELLRSDSALDAADALCYVLHLMGDVHQPLHCAALADGKYFSTPPEYDQGGNLIRWGADKKRGAENLHALWDDAIVAKAADIENRVVESLEKFKPGHFGDSLLDLELDQIALESFEMAKKGYTEFLDDVTYLGESQAQKGGQQFSSPTPTYRNELRTKIRERAALAGYRLAGLLERTLVASPDAPAPKKKAAAVKKKTRAARR